MYAKNIIITKARNLSIVFYLTFAALILFAGSAYAAAPTTPVSNVTPGWYNSPQTVSLTVDGVNAAATYYTLDNTSPTQSSTPYTGPITLSETGPNNTVTLRAVSYDASNVRGNELVLTLIFDTVAPKVVVVNSLDSRHIALNFDSDVTNADRPENYTFTGGVNVINAAVQLYGVVELTVDKDLVEGTTYDFTISNVCDLAGNTLQSSQFSFTYDTIQPEVVSAAAITDLTIKVEFSEKVDQDLAEYPLSYIIDGYDIVNATLLGDGKSVILTVDKALTPGTYSVEAAVSDLNGNNINATKNSATFIINPPTLPDPTPTPPPTPVPNPTPSPSPSPNPIPTPPQTSPIPTPTADPTPPVPIAQNNSTQSPEPGSFAGNLIEFGSTGKIVETIQDKLKSIGFDSGVVDGIVGPQTQNAIIKFQRANNLIADGIIGPITWAKLFGLNLANETGIYTNYITMGQYSFNIAIIQAKLTRLRFNDDNNCDGLFGLKTLAAIKSFQEAKGLEVDGIIGPVTWSALFI